MKLFSLNITTPEEAVFSGELESIVLPVLGGAMEVLADHAPCIAVFGDGTIKIKDKLLVLGKGYAKIEKNSVQLFPEEAFWDRRKTSRE